ncbi:hypothetical protein [Epibacterium ulvae]|uniref:hypothetical protein n=1 Tax=Epibacterium ulvae TaxID=1156985 RepID=UPI0024939944|nr:hypothetical protein [Epibacterium ulvae]
MTRRYAARADANQPQIVSALRRAGATVTATHAAGQGFPDLVVGYQGNNFLLEVKDGSKPPSERQLTPDQRDWHRDWRGQKAVVCNIAQAMAACGIELKGVKA